MTARPMRRPPAILLQTLFRTRDPVMAILDSPDERSGSISLAALRPAPSVIGAVLDLDAAALFNCGFRAKFCPYSRAGQGTSLHPGIDFPGKAPARSGAPHLPAGIKGGRACDRQAFRPRLPRAPSYEIAHFPLSSIYQAFPPRDDTSVKIIPPPPLFGAGKSLKADFLRENRVGRRDKWVGTQFAFIIPKGERL